jgi:hypothetical protein
MLTLSLILAAALILGVVLNSRIDGPDFAQALADAGVTAGGDVQPGDIPQGSPRTPGSPAPSPQPAAPPGQPAPGRRPGPAQPQPAAPAPQPAPGQQPGRPQPAQPQSQPAGSRIPAGPPQPGAPAPAWSFRDQLMQAGWDTSSYPDDAAAWQAFQGGLNRQLAEVQQARELARYGQYYLANRQQIDAFMRGQPAPGAAPQPGQSQPVRPGAPTPGVAGPLWNNVPEWKPEWRDYMTEDGLGNLRAKDGADPTLPMKYQEYLKWQRATLDGFLRDPIGTLKQGLVDLVREQATQLATSTTQNYDEHQWARQYVAAQDWIIQKDPTTGVALQNTMTGQPLLTPLGQMFFSEVQRLRAAGVSDVRMQQQLAERAVMNSVLLSEYQRLSQPAADPNAPPPAPQPGQPPARGGRQAVPAAEAAAPAAGVHPGANPINAGLLNRAAGLGGARRIAQGGAQGQNPAPSPNLPPPNLGSGSFANRLTAAFRAAGLSPESIA